MPGQTILYLVKEDWTDFRHFRIGVDVPLVTGILACHVGLAGSELDRHRVAYPADVLNLHIYGVARATHRSMSSKKAVGKGRICIAGFRQPFAERFVQFERYRTFTLPQLLSIFASSCSCSVLETSHGFLHQ
jgi:hypothetical protein